MKAFVIINLLFAILYQTSNGQNWLKYPTPTIGVSKYIEFYKDSMILIQSTNNQCYVSFDLGQKWTLAMEGISNKDVLTNITLGKDLNFYSRGGSNIYKYSISNNYWVKLIGDCDCNSAPEDELQVDNMGNIYFYYNFYPSSTYKKSNYYPKNADPYYYIGEIIVLNSEKIVNYHSERGTINFIDRDGGINQSINLLKHLKYIFFSDHFQNMYFHDNKNLYIFNINTFQVDSIMLFNYSDNYNTVKIFQNLNHDLLISAGGASRYTDELLYSKDGGFSFVDYDHFVLRNLKYFIDNLHFLPDNNVIVAVPGALIRSIGMQTIESILPGNNSDPNYFVKSMYADYFFYYDQIFYKPHNTSYIKPLVIDNYFKFSKPFKDNEGTIHIFNSIINTHYYKLRNSSTWIKLIAPILKYTIVRYLTDYNGVNYAMDSTEIVYTKNKGITWNALYKFPEGHTTYDITSVDNLFYFETNNALTIIDPINSNSTVIQIERFVAVNNTKKLIYYTYIPGIVKGFYKYYLIDSLQGVPRLIYQSSKGLTSRVFNNSFWLFNKGGVYNFSNKDYFYSSQGLPDNSSGNIFISDILLDENNYLYAFTDTGVYVYRDKINDQTTKVFDLGLKISQIAYPNPASTQLNIVSETQIESIEIVSIDSKIIKRIEVNKNIYVMDISNLSSGLYYLKYFLNSGKYSLGKFIKI